MFQGLLRFSLLVAAKLRCWVLVTRGPAARHSLPEQLGLCQRTERHVLADVSHPCPARAKTPPVPERQPGDRAPLPSPLQQLERDGRKLSTRLLVPLCHPVPGPQYTAGDAAANPLTRPALGQASQLY